MYCKTRCLPSSLEDILFEMFSKIFVQLCTIYFNVLGRQFLKLLYICSAVWNVYIFLWMQSMIAIYIETQFLNMNKQKMSKFKYVHIKHTKIICTNYQTLNVKLLIATYTRQEWRYFMLIASKNILINAN